MRKPQWQIEVKRHVQKKSRELELLGLETELSPFSNQIKIIAKIYNL